MKELIKRIREYIGLSQLEMAKKLGIQFATVNRWENGHSIPNSLAQEALFELCEEYNVPFYQMILDKVKQEVDNLTIEDGRVILFHGSKNGIVGEIKPISREKCDFGKGFYMGTTAEQPLTLICDFDDAKFYIVSIDTKDLNIYEVNVDIDWAMLVAYNRGKMERIKNSKFYTKYSNMMENKDLVIGSIADDKMFVIIDNFFLETITDKALINSLSALELGKQYVALTEKACKKVKIEKEIELSLLERKVLQKISKENRQKGIDLADEVCKKHRRDGKFFDEILNDALRGENK